MSLGNMIVPQDEIMRAESLRIEVIEGPEINRGTCLEINACGLVGSRRGKNDGCTILGCQSTNAKGECLNDFVIT